MSERYKVGQVLIDRNPNSYSVYRIKSLGEKVGLENLTEDGWVDDCQFYPHFLESFDVYEKVV